MIKLVCNSYACVNTQEAEFAPLKETPPSNMPQRTERGAVPHGRAQQETLGGYDCEFVEPPKSAFKTDCPICFQILRDPYLSLCCGTSFCQACIERFQANHAPCPTCREENFAVIPNKPLRRSLNQLRVLCTFNKDGCKWTGELGELQHHLNEVNHSGES